MGSYETWWDYYCIIYISSDSAVIDAVGLVSETIWYDTIYLRALRIWRYGQLSLAHGTETKKTKKLKTKTEQLGRNGPGKSQSGRKKWNYGGGICETGRLVLSRKWKREGVMDEQSGESEEEQVMSKGK